MSDPGLRSTPRSPDEIITEARRVLHDPSSTDGDLHVAVERLLSVVDALVLERDREREALEEVARYYEPDCMAPPHVVMSEIARAALAEEDV